MTRPVRSTAAHDLLFLLSTATVLDAAVSQLLTLDAIKNAGAFEYAEIGSRGVELELLWSAARAELDPARNGETSLDVSIGVVASLVHMREEMMEAATRCLDELQGDS